MCGTRLYRLTVESISSYSPLAIYFLPCIEFDAHILKIFQNPNRRMVSLLRPGPIILPPLPPIQKVSMPPPAQAKRTPSSE